MKWVDVKEKDKLPENYEYVLFTDGVQVYKGYRIGSPYFEGEWLSCTDIESKVNQVTHWMSLPPLPKVD